MRNEKLVKGSDKLARGFSTSNIFIKSVFLIQEMLIPKIFVCVPANDAVLLSYKISHKYRKETTDLCKKNYMHRVKDGE